MLKSPERELKMREFSSLHFLIYEITSIFVWVGKFLFFLLKKIPYVFVTTYEAFIVLFRAVFILFMAIFKPRKEKAHKPEHSNKKSDHS